jgi:hypothetical protein
MRFEGGRLIGFPTGLEMLHLPANRFGNKPRQNPERRLGALEPEIFKRPDSLLQS